MAASARGTLVPARLWLRFLRLSAVAVAILIVRGLGALPGLTPFCQTFVLSPQHVDVNVDDLRYNGIGQAF